MNIILLGPQGSGKGTQAELLAEKFGLQHLEMGRIFRNIARSDNPRAGEISTMINEGRLAPDELTGQIAQDFITKHHPEVNGFIFEGYPRTVGQYIHVKNILGGYGKKLDAVFNIEISETETVKRLSTRWTCKKCGRVFSQPGVCAECGGELFQRNDDKPEAIAQRLRIYRELTHPVFELAVKDGVGVEINGEQSIEKVHEEILTNLREKKLVV